MRWSFEIEDLHATLPQFVGVQKPPSYFSPRDDHSMVLIVWPKEGFCWTLRQNTAVDDVKWVSHSEVRAWKGCLNITDPGLVCVSSASWGVPSLLLFIINETPRAFTLEKRRDDRPRTCLSVIKRKVYGLRFGQMRRRMQFVGERWCWKYRAQAQPHTIYRMCEFDSGVTQLSVIDQRDQFELSAWFRVFGGRAQISIVVWFPSPFSTVEKLDPAIRGVPVHINRVLNTRRTLPWMATSQNMFRNLW